MSRYSVPAQDPVLTSHRRVGQPPGHVFRPGVRPLDRGRGGGRPPVDRHRIPGDPHGGSAPGPAHRLGHHPARHRGLPHARSTGRHAAYPAAALGTAVPARHGDTPPRPCLTQRQREPHAPLWPRPSPFDLWRSRPWQPSTTSRPTGRPRPSATTPPMATCAASPPGWLEATRSAPTRPRPPAVVSASDPALVLLGRCDLADAARTADEAAGGLAARICGSQTGRR